LIAAVAVGVMVLAGSTLAIAAMHAGKRHIASADHK
jgi:hypothetical protein